MLISNHKKKRRKIIFEMDIKEKWKKIKNYPYKISDHGRIKRDKFNRNTYIGKILKQNLGNHGYLSVLLCGNGKPTRFLIHRLVAEAFLGPCPKGKEVNHIDGNKLNPYVGNLEYITSSENMKHAYRLGLRNAEGEKNGQSKLIEKEVVKIRKMHMTGKYNYKQLAKKFNISKTIIGLIVRKKIWKCVL